jgi:chemotaxis methyl-accepting protein methylase
MELVSTPTRNARGARFRHIVFKADAPGGAVDLAPPRVELPPAPRARGATAAGRGADAALTAEEEALVAELFERAGLDARAYRRETLRRRLPACLRLLRAAGVADALLRVRQQPVLAAAAVGTLVIGVTSFFRDASVFDHLSYTVLPALVRGTGATGASSTAGRPRVWSVGCSDGAELYSVAILLAEMGLLDGAFLLGTDCRPAAVARAREGFYAARQVRDVPAVWLERYFVREPRAQPHQQQDQEAWRVIEPLRRAGQWRTADVLRLQEPGTWDLILCRNVAMYFRPEAAGRLWAQLECALRPGGFLILGKAERPLAAQHLGYVAPCIYRRDRI